MQFSVGKTLWFHFPYSFGCEKILLTSCDPCVVSGLHTGHFDLKSLSPPPPLPLPAPSARVSWSVLMGRHLGTTTPAMIRIYALSNGKTYPEIQRCWYNALCFNGEFFCPSSMKAPSECFLLLL